MTKNNGSTVSLGLHRLRHSHIPRSLAPPLLPQYLPPEKFFTRHPLNLLLRHKRGNRVSLWRHGVARAPPPRPPLLPIFRTLRACWPRPRSSRASGPPLRRPRSPNCRDHRTHVHILNLLWFNFNNLQRNLTCLLSFWYSLLLTIPPSVGYEQNPLSLYYCYDIEGSTRCLKKCIAEVGVWLLWYFILHSACISTSTLLAFTFLSFKWFNSIDVSAYYYVILGHF